jgi:orotate phosphoribosyltransferase-like protein
MGGLTGPNTLRDWAEIEHEARVMEDLGYRRWEIHETLDVSVTWLRWRLGPSSYRGKPHPDHLRRRVEELHWRGLTLGQIAYRVNVPKSTCHEWLSQLAHYH